AVAPDDAVVQRHDAAADDNAIGDVAAFAQRGQVANQHAPTEPGASVEDGVAADDRAVADRDLVERALHGAGGGAVRDGHAADHRAVQHDTARAEGHARVQRDPV